MNSTSTGWRSLSFIHARFPLTNCCSFPRIFFLYLIFRASNFENSCQLSRFFVIGDSWIASFMESGWRIERISNRWVSRCALRSKCRIWSSGTALCSRIIRPKIPFVLGKTRGPRSRSVFSQLRSEGTARNPCNPATPPLPKPSAHCRFNILFNFSPNFQSIFL